MPFRKKKNGEYLPYWYISITLPASGPTGTLSTRARSKRVAQQMEAMLRRLDEQGYYEIIDALKPLGRGRSGRVTLPQVMKAWRRKRIDILQERLEDPPLREAIKEAAASITYENHRLGLRHLMTLAPEKARLSWVVDPGNINKAVADMRARGYADNTIRNGLWNGISQLLQFHLGRSRAREVMMEARRPSSDDRRDIHLSPEELHEVMSHCEWEMRMFVLIVAGLGIDLSPALRTRVRDVDFERWTLYVDDRKNAARKRTIDCPAAIMYALRVLSDGKGPDERIFELTSGQITHRWAAARTKAQLTKSSGYHADVRIKDLRHTFSVHYLKSGGNVAGLQHRMGHVRGTQSLDYARHETRGIDDMEAAAEAMGLRLPAHLRAELPARAVSPEQQHEIPAWWFDPGAGEPGPRRYQKRGTAGWSGEDRTDTNREYMRELRRRTG